MRFEPFRYCIENLLPQGIAMISGAPKTGKSWLMLDWSIRIAKGEPVWNFSTTKGTALYLCLEDNWNRVQSRLLEVTDEVPNNVFFAVSSCSLTDGLTQQIEHFVKEHPDTVLVTIDTFQMIRSADNDLSYSNDYHEIGILKELADRLHITILLVHHLRKQNDSDPMNKISGTTGLSGALDTALILQKEERGQNQATLICTGRDIEHRELKLSFSKDTHIWDLISDSIEKSVVSLPDEMCMLTAFMKEKKYYNGSNTEFVNAFNSFCGKNTEVNCLKRLMNKYRYELENHGVRFESRRCNGKRILTIEYHSDSDDSDDKFTGVKNIVNIGTIDPVAPCVPICGEITKKTNKGYP